jgi:hypothetical protein
MSRPPPDTNDRSARRCHVRWFSRIAGLLALLLVVSACSAAARPSDAPRPTTDPSPTPTPTRELRRDREPRPDAIGLIHRALDAAHGIRSFRADVKLSGTLAGDLVGRGSDGALDVGEITATVDVDLARSATYLRFSAPAFLGMEGEVIVIGPDTWQRNSIGGRTWEHITSAVEDRSATPWATVVSDIDSMLRTDSMAPRWMRVEDCPGKPASRAV